jgi:hypothetical protein
MVEKIGLQLLQHPHPKHVHMPNDSEDIKIGYRVKVPFKIGEYVDTIECDVVPMTVCHLLLGRPWQYDHSSQHCGRSNRYTINWKGKEMILKPMTPQQIIVEYLQKSFVVKVESEKEREKNNLSAISKSGSESHMPNFSDKNKRAGENLVMITTKSEMRDVRNNPTEVLIVLVYKDTLVPANNLTSIYSVIAHVLQDYNDVFPEETLVGLPPLRGIEHQIDLALGVALPNCPAYQTNSEETKEIQRQVQALLDKGHMHESLNPCVIPVILVPKKRWFLVNVCRL